MLHGHILSTCSDTDPITPTPMSATAPIDSNHEMRKRDRAQSSSLLVGEKRYTQPSRDRLCNFCW